MNGKNVIKLLDASEISPNDYSSARHRKRTLTRREFLGSALGASLAPGAVRTILGAGIARARQPEVKGRRPLWWAEPRETFDSEWSLRPIAAIPTSHRLRWADLNGDGNPELVDAPIVGFGAKPPDFSVGAPLTWFEPPEGIVRPRASGAKEEVEGWTPHLIDRSLTVVHGINILDWDGDGRDEILTASFEGVHLFDSTGRGLELRWKKTRLAAGDQSPKPGISSGAAVRKG